MFSNQKTEHTAQENFTEPNNTRPYRLFCGDTRELLDTLSEETFSCIITSPPYWGMRTYGHDSEIGQEETLTEYIDNLVNIFNKVKRLLRKDGVFWLIMGDTYTSGNRTYRATDRKLGARAMQSRPRTPSGLKEKDLIGLPWRIAFALQAAGWYLRTDIIWAKPNPMPETVRDRPHRSHEFIFQFSKEPNYFFDQQAFAHPILGRGSFGKSVWTVSVGRRKTNHPAAFPMELIMPCIISSTRPGDLVLDPFAGSASVGLASLRLGRRFVGIEIVKDHVISANTALSHLADQNSLQLCTDSSMVAS